MAARPKRARSSAKQLDDALKEVRRLRAKYDLPPLRRAADAADLGEHMSEKYPNSYIGDHGRLVTALQTVERIWGSVPDEGGF